MALFIVALMNINSYAAVSGNDGSAFVTKAEFDALVNTFNEQMNNYEASVISKVDGAIANYLAGLSNKQTTTNNILLSSWTDIAAFNGSYAPSFDYPEVNVLYAGGMNNYYSWASNQWWKMYALAMICRLKNTPSKTSNKYRALFKSNKAEDKQSEADNKLFWDGIAINYYERYSINSGIFSDDRGVDLAALEAPESNTYQFKFINPVNLLISDGYNSTFASNVNNLKPTVQWKCSSKDYWNEVSFPKKNLGAVAEVELLKEGNDQNKESKMYKHIIQYSGDTLWCLSNENFTKTFRTHESNTSKTNTLLENTTKTAKAGYTATSHWGSSNTSFWSDDTTSYGFGQVGRSEVTYEYENDTDLVLPSVGMLASDVAAKGIYQMSESIQYQYGNKTGTIDPTTLEKGFPLLAAAKDNEITWMPKFTKGKVLNSSGQWVDSSATNVKLMLSMGQFSDKIASTNLIDASSTSGKTTDGGLVCPINQTPTISFTMPSDGVVWAKWVPNTGDYDTASWIQPLDIKSSNTYVLTVDD